MTSSTGEGGIYSQVLTCSILKFWATVYRKIALSVTHCDTDPISSFDVLTASAYDEETTKTYPVSSLGYIFHMLQNFNYLH